MALVYRAARAKDWIVNGVIQEKSFFRRSEVNPETNERRDERGLSVASTPEAAAQHLTKCPWMIEIDTEKLHQRGYTLVPDGDHFSIPEPPFDVEEDRSKVLAHAAVLIECCRQVPYTHRPKVQGAGS